MFGSHFYYLKIVIFNWFICWYIFFLFFYFFIYFIFFDLLHCIKI